MDGLKGIEIGGAVHNQFGLQTLNVDNSVDTVFKKKEVSLAGTTLRVDLIAEGDELPLADNSQDFVLTSHVIEHFLDPIKALKEWCRVVRDGGYILAVVPHKERTFDKDRPRTPLSELIERHAANLPRPAVNKHFSVWIAEDFAELIEHLGWKLLEIQDPDDKVGNGFTVVIKVQKSDFPMANDLEFFVDYACARDAIPPDALQRMIGRMYNAYKGWTRGPADEIADQQRHDIVRMGRRCMCFHHRNKMGPNA